MLKECLISKDLQIIRKNAGTVFINTVMRSGVGARQVQHATTIWWNKAAILQA